MEEKEIGLGKEEKINRLTRKKASVVWRVLKENVKILRWNTWSRMMYPLTLIMK